MAKVEIADSLLDELKRKFKKESHKIVDLMESLEENPYKGKAIGNVGKIVIKELKYKKFRFYFVTEGYKIRFFAKKDLSDLLIKFVRMSDKKNQQKVIDEIKRILRTLGGEGF